MTTLRGRTSVKSFRTFL